MFDAYCIVTERTALRIYRSWFIINVSLLPTTASRWYRVRASYSGDPDVMSTQAASSSRTSMVRRMSIFFQKIHM